MAQERRGSKRITLSGPIRYQHKGSQRFGNSIGRDISMDGLGFISNEFFPISTDLVFEVQHPERPEFIKAVGKIIWISNQPHSDRYFVGAKFLGPPVHI